MSIDLSSIENEIVDIEKNLNNYKIEIEKVNQQIISHAEKLTPLKDEFTKKKQEGDVTAEENKKHTEILTKILEDITKVTGEILQYEEQKKMVINKMTEEETKKTAITKELEKLITGAKTISPERVYPEKDTTSPALSKLIEELQHKVRSEEEQ